MSVSQVKKQFENFATYLGRDAAGLERLKKLKDSVNELRTQLASSEANEAAAVATAEAMSKRSLAAEAELENAKNEIRRMQQVIRGLEVKAANMSVAPPQNEECGEESHSDMKHVIKRLTRRLKVCPQPERSHKNISRAYDRDSIASGWSHDAMWTLGAAIALLVMIDGSIVLQSKTVLRDLEDMSESAKRSFFRWFRSNVVLSGNEEKFLQATQGLCPGIGTKVHFEPADNPAKALPLLGLKSASDRL